MICTRKIFQNTKTTGNKGAETREDDSFSTSKSAPGKDGSPNSIITFKIALNVKKSEYSRFSLSKAMNLRLGLSSTSGWHREATPNWRSFRSRLWISWNNLSTRTARMTPWDKNSPVRDPELFRSSLSAPNFQQPWTSVSQQLLQTSRSSMALD